MSSSGTKILAVIIVIMIFAGGAYFLFQKSTQTPSTNTATVNTPVYNTAAVNPTQGVTLSDDSNAQLDKDLNSINLKLNDVDTETAGIDAGINQTAPNLGQ